MTSWHAQNQFLSGGFKFNLSSVKNNHNYKNKYFECVFWCMVRNITGRATTPDTTVLLQSLSGISDEVKQNFSAICVACCSCEIDCYGYSSSEG